MMIGQLLDVPPDASERAAQLHEPALEFFDDQCVMHVESPSITKHPSRLGSIPRIIPQAAFRRAGSADNNCGSGLRLPGGGSSPASLFRGNANTDRCSLRRRKRSVWSPPRSLSRSRIHTFRAGPTAAAPAVPAHHLRNLDWFSSQRNALYLLP